MEWYKKVAAVLPLTAFVLSIGMVFKLIFENGDALLTLLFGLVSVMSLNGFFMVLSLIEDEKKEDR